MMQIVQDFIFGQISSRFLWPELKDIATYGAV